MHILITGAFYSGSGAIIDWLKDFPEIGKVNGEFDIVRNPGELAEMIDARNVGKKKDYAYAMIKRKKKILNRQKIINDEKSILLKNFLKKRINIIPSINYKIRNVEDYPYYKSRYVNEITVRYLKEYLNSISSINNEEEIEFWRNWFLDIMKPFHQKYKSVLLDQPIYLNRHIHLWQNIFEPYKIIMVHRNPLDQFAEVIRQGLIHSRHTYVIDRFDHENSYNPKNPTDAFIRMLEKRYDKIIEYKNQFNNNILIISFEEFINNFDYQTQQIKIFLNIKTMNDSSFISFNPNNSMKNIGIGYEDWATRVIGESGVLKLEKLNMYRKKLFS